MPATQTALSPRSAAAYAAALRTLPNIAWARSIVGEQIVVKVKYVFEGGVQVSIDLNTVEECVDSIRHACEDCERD